jgi:hypothetical protein
MATESATASIRSKVEPMTPVRKRLVGIVT